MIANLKNTEKIYLFFLLILLLNHHVNGYLADDEIKGIYCGKVLSRAIEEICPNGINGPKLSHRRKRLYTSEFNKDVSPHDTDEEQYDFDIMQVIPPVLTGLYNVERYYSTRNRRSIMINIVQECCKNPCSVSTLKQYCR